MKKLIFAVIAGAAFAGAVQAQETYPKTYVGVGVASVRPDNKELLAKLNTALEGIKANGEFQKINDKWFPSH